MHPIRAPNENDTEMSSNQRGIGKVGKNLFGNRVRADIVVFRNHSEQLVTHTTSDEVSLVSTRAQVVDDNGR